MTIYYRWYANEIYYPHDTQLRIFKHLVTGDSRYHSAFLCLVTIVRTPPPPPPTVIKGGFDFFKIDGNGGGLNILLEKGG